MATPLAAWDANSSCMAPGNGIANTAKNAVNEWQIIFAKVEMADFFGQKHVKLHGWLNKGLMSIMLIWTMTTIMHSTAPLQPARRHRMNLGLNIVTSTVTAKLRWRTARPKGETAAQARWIFRQLDTEELRICDMKRRITR